MHSHCFLQLQINTVLIVKAFWLIALTWHYMPLYLQERCPPLIEDFLYICDDAYRRSEFLEMERMVLKTIGFDIGMPLSYRFLRRYAKVRGRAALSVGWLGLVILISRTVCHVMGNNWLDVKDNMNCRFNVRGSCLYIIAIYYFRLTFRIKFSSE